MGYSSNIDGIIEGVSEDSFLLIKEDLEEVFEDVSWMPEEVIETVDKFGQMNRIVGNKGGAIEIHSYGKHYDQWMHPVYDKIAFCIDDGGGGSLDYEGQDAGDMGSIFFTVRKWEMVWAEIIWPQNPFIQPDVDKVSGKEERK